MVGGYMYILLCSDGSYYTGSTKHLEKRFTQHQSGEGANHTAKRLPVKLVYYEEFTRIDEAFAREKQVQGWSRKKKEALIESRHEDLPMLSKSNGASTSSATEKTSSATEKTSSATEKTSSATEKTSSATKTTSSDTEKTRSATKTTSSKTLPEHVEGNTLKQTEIGLIPKDWEVKKLEDIAKISMGQSPSSYFYNERGDGLPLIQGNADIKNRKTITRFFTSLITKEAKKDEVIMTVRAPVGEIAKATFHCCIGRGVCSISYPNNFIFHCLISYKNFWSKFSTGSTFDSVNSKQVKNLYISIPPTLAEQKAIAQALTDVDDLITQLDKLIRKKKAIKQGTMQELLTGKKRLKGFTGDWEVKKLEDMGFSISGLSGKSKSDFENGNFPYITFLNVMNNVVIDINTFEYVKINKEENQNKFSKGDLFFNTSSETPEEVGMCATLLEDVENLYLNSFCFGFRLNSEDDSLFLSYLINSNIGRKKFSLIGQGATRYNLSKSNFNKIEIFIPDKLKEQKAIAQILSDMDTEIEALETQKSKTQRIKEGMMQELLTGKTRLIKPAVNVKSNRPQFEDAILIGTMAHSFASKEFPLTRFMYTKVSYLFKRYKKIKDEDYLKKAAGPYKHKTRYYGAENIAIQKKYVVKQKSHYKGESHDNFLTGENAGEAVGYFKKWYGTDALQWIQQFKFTKRTILGLWATVDMAMEDLKHDKKPINLQSVKTLIENNKEWKPKLRKEEFSDKHIMEAMKKIPKLYNS